MGVLAHGQTHRVDVVNGTYGTLSLFLSHAKHEKERSKRRRADSCLEKGGGQN